MTRKEYYAAVQAYKDKFIEHRAVPAPLNGDIEDWESRFFVKAVAAASKMKIARLAGKRDDESRYEKEWQGYMDKLSHCDPKMVSQINQNIEALSNDKLNEVKQKYSVAKHSDEVMEHGEWKKHKYIRIENGRYIYPEDNKEGKDLYNKVNKAAEDSAKAISSGNREEMVKAHNQYAQIVEAHGLDDKKRGNDSRTFENKFGEKTAEKLKENAQKGSGESYEKAKAEGNAMQAWKDEKARAEKEAQQKLENEKRIKEAAKSGSGESYEKAKAEGDAYQKWKDAQANKVSESSKGTSGQTADEYFKNYRKNTEEMATVRSNGSILFNILAYKAYNDDSLGGSGYDTGKVAQILANNLYSNYSAALNNGLSKEESKKFVEKYVEEMYDAIKTSAGLSGYETTMNPIEVSYDSNGAPTNVNVKFYSIKKKEAKHSIEPLSGEEYFAAVRQYKDALEHKTNWKDHKKIKSFNGNLVYEDPEAEEATEKYQRDGKKKTVAPVVAQYQDAGKRRTERAQAMMATQIAQNRGKKLTEKTNAPAAVDKYQEDGMKKTFQEEQKKKAVESQAKTLSSKYGDNNSKNQAQSEGDAYQKWLDEQKKKKQAKHSIEPLSKDEYYAAIEEYKRKKA